jgi:hypothetical protein
VDEFPAFLRRQRLQGGLQLINAHGLKLHNGAGFARANWDAFVVEGLEEIFDEGLHDQIPCSSSKTPQCVQYLAL